MSKIIEIKQHPDESLQPEWHKSKMGYDFDYNAERWPLDGSLSICISRLKPLDSQTKEGAKKTLCRYAEEMSAGLTLSVFNSFNVFLHATNETTVTVASLTNWLATLNSNTEFKLGALRPFFVNWYDWGFKGIDKDIVKFLKEIELRGVTKGKAVKTACPHTGPLTSNEFGAVLDWSANAYSRSELTLEEFALLLTLAFTGRRPINIRSLRAKDLVADECKDGCDYIINFPRAKQKNTTFRSQFSPVTVNKELYLILYNLTNESISKVERVVDEKLTKIIRNEVPIFINTSRLTEISSINDFKKVMGEKSDFFHMTKGREVFIFQEMARKCTAKSERTGDFIHLITRRFRYTKGTNLSRRGIRGVALAVALDHTNTENIGVYAQNTEEVAEYITAIMAPVLAPLAQAFSGKLVASERDAIRGDDPHSRIKNMNHQNVGTCGTYVFCASGYKACYTCINFQPWIDAAHEEVLEEILQERDRQKEAGVSLFVIQSTDRLLLAVQQVADLCAEEKAKPRLV